MTRKAARKRRQQAAKQSARLPPGRSSGLPWVTLGTLVASTAINGLLPNPASARELAHASFVGQRSEARASSDLLRDLLDPRGSAGVIARSPNAIVGRAAFSAMTGQSQPSQPLNTQRFDIPAGPLSDVLSAFERVTGMHVTLDIQSIGVIQSPGVSGALTAEQALQTLLTGTSVRFRQTSSTSAVLELATHVESVDVTGSRPGAVLSSPKYTQPLRDTPQTIVVIPQSVLQDQGAVTLRDALRNTPGITLTAGEGGTAPGDNLLIRGFSARNDVYIDGARDPGVVSRDTFNTEAIEVAKGPSSVTAGRGSTGGSVNLVTKSASLQNAGQVRFGGGNADQKRGTIDVNRRLSETVAVRLNGVWQDSGVPGRDDVSNTNALATDNAAAIEQLTRYWLVSAMASHRLSRHVDLQLNLTNLANERYVERGYTGHFVPGPGRSVVVSPIITF